METRMYVDEGVPSSLPRGSTVFRKEFNYRLVCVSGRKLIDYDDRFIFQSEFETSS